MLAQLAQMDLWSPHYETTQTETDFPSLGVVLLLYFELTSKKFTVIFTDNDP